MKKISSGFLLTVLAAVLPFLFSCQKQEPVRTTTAIVTVRADEPNQSVTFQLDEQTVAYPSNIKISDFGSEPRRALINFSKPEEGEVNPVSSVGPMIHVNWIQFILTKPMAEDFGDENALEYGEDPVELVYDWVTLVEDGYLNLRFRTLWSNYGITHRINLVYTPQPDNPYCVTLYHDAMDDRPDYESDSIVAFKLDGLPDTGGETVDLKVRWTSFMGPKSATFKYSTKKASN